MGDLSLYLSESSQCVSEGHQNTAKPPKEPERPRRQSEPTLESTKVQWDELKQKTNTQNRTAIREET